MEFWRNRRVLITGHTGFKGSWLSLWLHGRGARVVGFALPPHTSPNLFELAGIDRRIQSVIGDVRDLESLRTAYADFEPEIVFHLAAQSLVRPSYLDPVSTYSTNVLGTVHLLEAARKTPSARAIVNVTSDKCYENLDTAQAYREDSPMGGYDPYSSSKGCAELVTSSYRRSFALRVGSARAGNVIGGGDWSPHRLVPDCIRSLSQGQPIEIRNPDFVRPWQHVLEPLSGYLRLAERLSTAPEFARGWNFGPGAEDAVPVSSLAERMAACWGTGGLWRQISGTSPPHEARSIQLDSSASRALLGWQPRLKLEVALQWVVDWYRRQAMGEAADALCAAQIDAYENLIEPAREPGVIFPSASPKSSTSIHPHSAGESCGLPRMHREH